MHTPCLISEPFRSVAVADVLLWRDRNLSAGILAGATVTWFLFDVVEYNAVTLL